VTQPAALPDATGPAAYRAVRLEQATIAYNLAEGIIAIGAGLAAGSVALLGLGFDSWIEVAAATVVLARLRAELRGGHVEEAKQRRALRFGLADLDQVAVGVAHVAADLGAVVLGRGEELGPS